MSDYSKTCTDIIDAVGGLDNIVSVAHCATRLRLVLVDKNKYDHNVIDKIDNVQGLFFNSGQLQIIFGLNVPQVYNAFISESQKLGKDFTKVVDTKPKKQNFVMAILKSLPPIIMPTLGVMVGCALVTALLTIINIILQQGFNVDITSNNWYMLFNNIGSLVTNFLVLYICLSAAKLWKVNIFIAAAVGIFLVAGPALGTLIPGWSYYDKNSIGNLPYTSSIFTGILAIKFCSIIEHWLDKKVSDNWKMFVVGGVCIVLTILFSILIFGPIMAYVEKGLGIASSALSDPKLYGFGLAILSFLFAPLVITGVHQVFVPIILLNIANNGYDFLVMSMLASNIAQGAAAISIAIKSKEIKTRSLGYSSGLIALLGITEPAMFGVNLRDKRAFISAMLGAFVSGWFMGFMKTAQIGNAGSPGILTLLFALPDPSNPKLAAFTNLNIAWMAIGIAISFAVTMLIALLWLSKKPSAKETWFSKKMLVVKNKWNEINVKFNESKFMQGYESFKRNIVFLYDKKAKMEYQYPNLPQLNQVDAPVEGNYIKLSDVKDPIFSSGAVGIGFAIDPKSNIVKAPFNGEVSMLFDTKHAIALKSNDGIELLIHIGIDTVKLEGKYFKTYVGPNDKVKVGQKLIKFNYKKLAKLNYQNCVISVITNVDQNKKYNFVAENNNQINIKENQEIISVL